MKKIIIIISTIYIVLITTITNLYIFNIVDKDFVLSSVYAGILNLVNIIIAFGAFEASNEKSNQKFLILNLGNMVLRILLILITIVVLFLFIKIDIVGFLLIFFPIYFIFLALEVYYFNLKIKSRNIKE